MHIRPALSSDHDAIWSIIAPVIAAGETYALDRAMMRTEALDYWTGKDRQTFVAEDADGRILGTYYLRANQSGGGDHVANAGYMVATEARGRGVAKALCAHSLDMARQNGFQAMQFNLVIATNERAISLWQKMGFAIVGRLPGAFRHPTLGQVDALVMFQRL